MRKKQLDMYSTYIKVCSRGSTEFRVMAETGLEKKGLEKKALRWTLYDTLNEQMKDELASCNKCFEEL